MFQSILIKNSFISKDIFIEFEDGLNILSAKNGFGKSTILEMLNYSLFGTQALRSSISDYPKDFEVICKILINSRTYIINRTVKNSYVVSDDEVVVTGITPVNSFIKELLNYDYKVFSLTNFVQQQNLLNLTSCSSTVLSDLIETISGINSSEKLESYLKSKLTELRIEKKSLIATKNGSNLESSFSINEAYELLLKIDNDYLNTTQLSLKLLNSRLADIKESLNQFEKYLISYENILENFKLFDSYEDISSEELTSVLIDIQKYETQLENEIKYKKNIYKPDKEYSKTYLEEQESLINEYKEYTTYLKLKNELDKHLIQCPNCDHKFYNADYSLKEIEEPLKPVLNLQEIKVHKKWLEDKDLYYSLENSINNIKNILEDLPSAKEIQLKLNTLNSYLSLKSKYSDLISEINSKLSEVKYKNTDLSENNYKEILELYINNLKTEQSELISNIEAIECIYIDMVKYVADKNANKTLLENLSKIDNLIDINQNKFKQYDLLLKTLLQVKKQIQSDTLPRINLLASNLIKSITNGERSDIKLTNDFKIEVDGKSVNVVEVSAQVITNISLRVALLDTFYRDNFLVFIGDEIDAPLHEDRFNYLEDCLENLTKIGYQIILVSHKEFNIGNNINLHRL